ncbi:MAG: amidase [Sphingomonadaceae bacterium]|nr:amidase [Sphingomonadaceae bacterium]
MTPPGPLAQTQRDLSHGTISSRALVEQCLARIEDKNGQGGKAFVSVDADAARAAADSYDQARSKGHAVPYFAGIPISIKDNIDMAGQVTAAGSIALSEVPAATEDALVVARLKGAGFITIGCTNMTEFAYSGLGLNPHHGTPLNPYHRATGHIPGGSSAGAAVSITDGMALGAIGTDTGGSCRITAAFCGIVGMKPTTHGLPMDGIFPLSQALDVVGPLGGSVECVAILHAAMAGTAAADLTPMPLRGLRFAIPHAPVFDSIEDGVAAAFDRAVAALEEQGALVERIAMPSLDLIPIINAHGGFSAVETYARLAELITAKDELIDPRVTVRILRGQGQGVAALADLHRLRSMLEAQATRELAPYTAMLMPTVPMTAPKLADLLADDDLYGRTNLLALRNPSIANMIGAPAISLPIGLAGGLPVGLSVMGKVGQDAQLLRLAATLETLFTPLARAEI